MTTRTDTRKSFLHDVFVTAMEGGVGYWSEALSYHWSLDEGGDDLDGFYAVVIETEDGDGRELRIDADVIARGIGKIERREASISEDRRATILEASKENDAGDIDSDLADCIVQAGLFLDIVYG